MDTLSIVSVGIIVAIAFGFSLWPLFQASGASSEVPAFDSDKERASEEIARLFSEREQAYKNIMEIELDHTMGKLSDEDYTDMIGQTRAEAVEILRRLESRGVKEGMAPAHVSVDEVSEAATRAAGSKEVLAASSSRNEDSPLDERLEEEILQFRETSTVVSPAVAENENSPTKRFCPSCGAEAGPDHSFCAACGVKLK